TAEGNVNSINPRPNLSFYVIATGVISTSPGQITVSTSNTGVTASVVSLNTSTQTAQIQLTGNGFNAGAVGFNNLSVTVVDSGISVTTTFIWYVFADGVMSVA